MNQVTNNHLVERARRLFGDATPKLQVAALPWREGESGTEILLVTSRDTGRWVMPKGGIEDGEELWDGAAREAEEEAGVTGAISRREAGRYFYAKVKLVGKAQPCEVIVYPLEVLQAADDWKESGCRTRRWFSPTEAANSVAEPELAELILSFGQDAHSYRADSV